MKNFLGAIQNNIVIVVVVLLSIFFVLTVGNLFIFHIYLIWTNQTTNEYVKGIFYFQHLKYMERGTNIFTNIPQWIVVLSPCVMFVCVGE